MVLSFFFTFPRIRDMHVVGKKEKNNLKLLRPQFPGTMRRNHKRNPGTKKVTQPSYTRMTKRKAKKKKTHTP
jgi:hypothetical protein